ncbi:MAG: rhomboid family intramembrane serine protease [Lachnospiraceae bacterium]|nr:rhomboid family intramembrane serine protease [Lachnospiraceae bacterium]
MKEKTGRFLVKKGFQKLEVPIPGIDVYFTIEFGYINALVLVTAEGEQRVTKEVLDNFLAKADWRGPDGETIDVHALTVIFAQNTESARELGGERSFCWYVDTENRTLIIDEGKCEDFYGMKSILQQALAEPSVAEDIPDSENDRETEKVACEQPEKKYIPYVNYGLLIANMVLFFACIFAGKYIYSFGVLDPVLLINEGQWYRFFTNIFLHGDAYHLCGNVIYLYGLGRLVEKEIGHIKYFVLYMLSGVIADFASLGFSVLTKDFTASLGASGAIFGITGALLWIVIRNRGHHEFATLPKMIFLIAFSLYNGFISTNVDNAAHIGGLIGGFLLAILVYRKKEKERGRSQ